MAPPAQPSERKAKGKLSSAGATMDVVRWYPQCSHVPAPTNTQKDRRQGEQQWHHRRQESVTFRAEDEEGSGVQLPRLLAVCNSGDEVCHLAGVGGGDDEPGCASPFDQQSEYPTMHLSWGEKVRYYFILTYGGARAPASASITARRRGGAPPRTEEEWTVDE